MKFRIRVLSTLIILLSVCAVSFGDALDQIQWKAGPSSCNIGKIAAIDIPSGYQFAGAEDTKVLMEYMQNPVSGNELGFLAPESFDWFLVFEFDKVGYIRDDEKDQLDADAMLKSIIEGNEAGNKERLRKGWSTLEITGWEKEPYYNDLTHNLEWAIKGYSEGSDILNHNTRILGRKGVMVVTLVVEPDAYSRTITDFDRILEDFSYIQGNRYEEFVQGDKVAKYGLSALVVGGGAAAAVKSGAFKWIWKVLVAGFVAFTAFFKRIFGGKSNKSDTGMGE